jgi:hypothetical protein
MNARTGISKGLVRILRVGILNRIAISWTQATAINSKNPYFLNMVFICFHPL